MTVRDLGLMRYEDAWAVQRDIWAEVDSGGPDVLVLVEHPPVLTLGAAFHAENLLYPPEYYAEKGIDLVPTDRGGDVTYHGPGQLVIYPIFDLRRHGSDLHKWMRDLEETIIIALGHWGIEGRRFPGYTGVWVDDKKVAAIGVKVRRWISIHGIALNCSNDPNDGFSLIVPCGIRDYSVTSLTELAGNNVSPTDAKPAVIAAFTDLFATT